MGLFSKLFGKGAPPPPPPPVDEDVASPGWEAIDAACAKLYPGQEPRHLVNGGVRWMMDISGKANPLDGCHIFDAGTFWHYVGLGCTELYTKEGKDTEWSGCGFEFTFRLRKGSEPMPPTWPVDLMNGLARPAMLGKIDYGPRHTVKTGPLAATEPTYVGVLLEIDPGLGTVDTPHGKVEFLQIVPVTAPQFERATGGNAHVVLGELAAVDPAMITDETPPR